MPVETIKATISIKAETMQQLIDMLQRAADEGAQLVQNAGVSTSIKLEAFDAGDLSEAISDVLHAVNTSDGVTANVNAPHTVWDGRRAAGLTPMEQYINRQQPESVTLSAHGRSVTLDANTRRNAEAMLRRSGGAE